MIRYTMKHYIYSLCQIQCKISQYQAMTHRLLRLAQTGMYTVLAYTIHCTIRIIKIRKDTNINRIPHTLA